MKIAIVGSRSLDSLEFNLNEAFNFNKYESRIFDIYEKNIFKNKFIYQFDTLGRKFFNVYDRLVFKHLASKIIDYNPDLIICVYRFIHPDFVKNMKRLKYKVIHINPDALTTFEYQQVFASPYDAYFTKDPYIFSFMRSKMNLNVKIYSEAFNMRLHIKPDVDKFSFENEVNIDVMTYGTIYPYRAKMLKYLIDNGVNLKIFGTKPNRFFDNSLTGAFQNKYIVGAEKSRLLYGSKIIFNQMHYAEIESVNNRFFEANGSGAFQLCDYKPILKQLLPIDPELVSFVSIDDGIDKINYYLKHPKERLELATQIYNHTLANYTYDHLIRFILKNID
ncbi:glycosyltransferase [uncultured Bacteroides sp.]|uniref:CgeB family protein n=1 Tax=uncultured Bacteroides sp. TaxID=162156 RepID=UPI002AAADC10|nr:glycosyltransferase [uncultured Bacteroides sp.]